jgi:hypothetical protein
MTVQDRIAIHARIAQKEIRADLAAGRFTAADIATFADLHTFVDANEYGLLCELDIEFPTDDAEIEFCAAVQDQVNDWIVNGGLTEEIN